MPHDAEITRQEVVLRDKHGGHDIVLVEKHEAPSNPDGSVAVDPYKERDREIAASMMKWLNRQYPGHLWGCVSDLRQGIVKFNIPILMGVADWWVINLRTHDVIDGLREGSGQILERYGLPRDRFHLARFLEARAQHSMLVNRRRKVPT